MSLESLPEKIYTLRLLLRNITAGDLTLLSDWANNPLTYGDYLTPEQADLTEMQERFANHFYANPHAHYYLIEQKQTGLRMGVIRLWMMMEHNHIVRICLRLCYPELRGQGFGTEVQKLVVRTVFEQCQKIDAIHIYTDMRNISEQRSIEKLGFINIANTMYQDLTVMRDGVVYELTRTQFTQQILLYTQL